VNCFARLIAGFTLMTNGKDDRGFSIEAVKRHITAVAKGDEPLAELRFHVLDRPPRPWLIQQDVHAFADCLDGTARRIRILVGKKVVKSFDVPQRCG